MSKVKAPITAETPFPDGSWSLWYHSSEEKKWTPSTYQQIHTVNSWGEFWGLINSLGDDTLLGGFFFLMKDPIPPLWENKGNIRGGSYTIRVPRRDATDIFIKYTVSSIIGDAMKSADNNIVGVSIAPKKAYNVISIWNNDFTRFNAVTDINILSKNVHLDEVRYTKHIDKKF
jgi:translation initiation factor 4E